MSAETRKIALYVATTGGPVLVDRITPEPAPQSVVCLHRSSEVLPISADYDDFVRPGSGVIMREFGPFPDSAFRLDVSGSIGGGHSWQLPVFVAHAVDAASGFALAPSIDEADEVLWLTGLVDYDLNIGAVNHIAEKIAASKNLFEACKAAGKTVSLILPEDRNLGEAKALVDDLSVTGCSNAQDLLARLGINPTASSAVVTAEKSGGSSLLWLLALLVIGALAFAGYHTLPGEPVPSAKESPEIQIKAEKNEPKLDVQAVKLPQPPKKAAETVEKSPQKGALKGRGGKIHDIAQQLLSGIERSRKAFAAKGDSWTYKDPARIIVWPFEGPNRRKVARLNDALLSALLELGEGRYTFMARDALKSIIDDMEATGALDDSGKDPVAALLERARDVDVMIRGAAAAEGDVTSISFQAVRMDGVILAQTKPKRFNFALRERRPKRREAKATTAPKTSGPLSLRLTTQRGVTPTYRIGEAMNLTLRLNRDSWVYCYYHQANGEIVQIFPNPPLWAAGRSPRLAGGRTYTVPGQATFPFDLILSPPAGKETLSCYAADRDVTQALPPSLRGHSLDALRQKPTEIAAAFKALGAAEVTESEIKVTVKE